MCVCVLCALSDLGRGITDKLLNRAPKNTGPTTRAKFVCVGFNFKSPLVVINKNFSSTESRNTRFHWLAGKHFAILSAPVIVKRKPHANFTGCAGIKFRCFFCVLDFKLFGCHWVFLVLSLLNVTRRTETALGYKINFASKRRLFYVVIINDLP